MGGAPSRGASLIASLVNVPVVINKPLSGRQLAWNCDDEPDSVPGFALSAARVLSYLASAYYADTFRIATLWGQ
jgi:hypothetical protein